jgi:hypothetical protein
MLRKNEINVTFSEIIRIVKYNQQKNIMNKYKKIVENVEKIIKVSGFHITAQGDESVGISSASWELRNDFYFDNQEELEEFKMEIRSLFEWYCGEVTSVVTFEEYEKKNGN